MSQRDIEFLKFTHLRGPSMWTYDPVIEALIDIHELEEQPSNTIPGFYERLSAWLPTLVEHRCSYDEHGGFLRRLKEGTWPGHIMEHVTLELQNLAGLSGGFGRAREAGPVGQYKVIVSAPHEEITVTALKLARDLVLAAMDDRPFDVSAAIETLRDLGDSLCLGPSTASIVKAAEERRIPSVRLTEGNLVQLGYGKRQRRIWTAETDQTSAIAESISRDKDLTKTLLAACGVPVPEGQQVSSADEAWEAAEDIGLPVVVKPLDGNHGRGVFIELNTREEIAAAYAVAVEEGSGVLVERCIPGIEHRVLVVGGKMVAANRGDMVSVIGDGRSTVEELIAIQVNSDPRRGDTEEHPLNTIRIDSAARIELARQGLSAEGIPAEGQTVLVQRNGNHAFDVTDEVHPSIASAAALAARIVGLDIAGIDLVVGDISRPFEEQGGAIVEVNAGPSLLMHLKPAEGKSRPVGKAIVDHLFPSGEDGRIPVVGISGTSGKTAVARLLGHILCLTGEQVGVACSDGLFYDHRHLQKTSAANWQSGRRILMSRTAEYAVIENGPLSILTEGLSYDRCQVGVVTNLQANDSLSAFNMQTEEDFYKIFRTQIDVVVPHGTGVLNADDAQVAEMAPLCDGSVIFYSLDADNPKITEHRARGRQAVFVKNGDIMTTTGRGNQEDKRLLAVGDPPLAGNSTLTAAVLAAIGAGLALGLPCDLIVAGIKTFNFDTLRAKA